MKRKLTEEEFNNLIYYLQGTCDSLENVLEHRLNIDYEDLDITDCYRLDEVLFNCECCGWWKEIYEMTDSEGANDRWICTECIP